MPGMDGDKALAIIRKTPGLEFLPVIAVTASTLINQENALRDQFSGYLRKPFSKRELFNELADFLPRHCTRRGAENDDKTDPAGTENATSAAVPAHKDLVSQLRRSADH